MHNKTIVGLVYAPWCGHCQALRPEWNKMKKVLSKDKYHIEEVSDSNMHTLLPQLNKKYGVQIVSDGFPTIFKIKNGNLNYYKGARNLKAMKRWVGGGDLEHIGFEGGNEDVSINERPHNSMAPISGGKRRCNKKTGKHRCTRNNRTRKSFFSRLFF